MGRNSLEERLVQLREEIPQEVKLVLVSKKQDIKTIKCAYDVGQRIFGENRVQELVDKYDALPKDIAWHLIGHLQRNKVKYIAPFVSMIHSVDSVRLLETINEQGKKNGRVIPCLFQVYVAQEETKYGFEEEELRTFYEEKGLINYEHVQICGIMAMATFTDDRERVKGEFRAAKNLFDNIKADYHADDDHFNTLSMGMSGDYLLAIEEGSTMVRVGSAIFSNT